MFKQKKKQEAVMRDRELLSHHTSQVAAGTLRGSHVLRLGWHIGGLSG